MMYGKGTVYANGKPIAELKSVEFRPPVHVVASTCVARQYSWLLSCGCRIDATTAHFVAARAKPEELIWQAVAAHRCP